MDIILYNKFKTDYLWLYEDIYDHVTIVADPCTIRCNNLLIIPIINETDSFVVVTNV